MGRIRCAAVAAATAAVWTMGTVGPATAEQNPATVEVDCGDFALQVDAQDFFQRTGPGDPHGLDPDGNGKACESLPGPASPTPLSRRSPQQNPVTLGVNCSDFALQADAQDFFQRTGPDDPHGLDPDSNGKACDGIPVQGQRLGRQVTTTTRPPSQPASFRDVDCSDFRYEEDAQTFFEHAGPGDPHRLDDDGDGRACEALPSAPKQTALPMTTTTTQFEYRGWFTGAVTDLDSNRIWTWIGGATAILLAVGGITLRVAVTQDSTRRRR